MEHRKFSSIIEIPKGTDRRIHMAYDKSGFVDLGPIKDQIPVNDGIMPVHYGYINNTLNKDEGDEVDVLVFSEISYKTGDQVEIEIIGMLTREDGDHKVVAIDKTKTIETLDDLSKDDLGLVLEYFGYKSKIIAQEGKEEALNYLENCKLK